MKTYAFGLSLTPCDIKDKECTPDSDGIVSPSPLITNSTFEGWYIGVNADGVLKTPNEHLSKEVKQ